MIRARVLHLGLSGEKIQDQCRSEAMHGSFALPCRHNQSGLAAPDRSRLIVPPYPGEYGEGDSRSQYRPDKLAFHLLQHQLIQRSSEAPWETASVIKLTLELDSMRMASGIVFLLVYVDLMIRVLIQQLHVSWDQPGRRWIWTR